ncbi:hypothetical protein A2673_03355 [Candidatus Kaiserbacteria bacterium RIFCSPHIGHO2_01_FULL_50_13]|uniref:Blue (type 1) copper domain-containing protein n=1 Tax=Candidatus Kaiserbacteria bacterium RIFCSPLOWO2_01_FULL_50_24 TaxID=1798507 RepID=A0A1F6EIP5_9BACT|nr:MAG: hypothetical protein A2673_03355 [Candidatus Kaiserbacteria bacterium RIFCSPHIGHO2_01_FULL_50_13]OGG73540.1 MAG: hypothetical protein A3A34_01195 [Candidatus Kaiserbacteria bacterium RIFCSPLOWO2_01_FULL_50_24]OGG81588.1 MAG: hypothetical protein A3H74_00730 [Candidatus Kaiserbacteria bacterium RIFCSPLOWO2_02_FULL_51_13]
MKWILLLVAGLIIVGGAWFLFIGEVYVPEVMGENEVVGNVEVLNPVADVPAADAAPITVTVTYDGSGFSPKEIVVKLGDTVTFVNASGGKMWVASAMHPTHTVYGGTSLNEHCPNANGSAFDQCAGGEGNYSFTFNKAGSWGYHDHLNASAFGRVTVE